MWARLLVNIFLIYIFLHDVMWGRTIGQFFIMVDKKVIFFMDVNGEYQAPEDIEEEEDVHSLLRSTAEDTDEEDEPPPQ
jgi:hypothetical protein